MSEMNSQDIIADRHKKDLYSNDYWLISKVESGEDLPDEEIENFTKGLLFSYELDPSPDILGLRLLTVAELFSGKLSPATVSKIDQALAYYHQNSKLVQNISHQFKDLDQKIDKYLSNIGEAQPYLYWVPELTEDQIANSYLDLKSFVKLGKINKEFNQQHQAKLPYVRRFPIPENDHFGIWVSRDNIPFDPKLIAKDQGDKKASGE